MNSNFEFKEQADYLKGEGSLKEVVVRHIKKISDISCQELTGSYTVKKPVKIEGGVFIMEEYHPDLREAYCNAIDFLAMVVYPDSDTFFKEYMDKEFKKEDGEMKDKIKQRKEIFRHINLMFQRANYFKRADSSDE